MKLYDILLNNTDIKNRYADQNYYYLKVLKEMVSFMSDDEIKEYSVCLDNDGITEINITNKYNNRKEIHYYGKGDLFEDKSGIIEKSNGINKYSIEMSDELELHTEPADGFYVIFRGFNEDKIKELGAFGKIDLCRSLNGYYLPTCFDMPEELKDDTCIIRDNGKIIINDYNDIINFNELSNFINEKHEKYLAYKKTLTEIK